MHYFTAWAISMLMDKPTTETKATKTTLTSGAVPAVTGTGGIEASEANLRTTQGPIRFITRVRTFDSLRYRNFALFSIATLMAGGAVWVHQIVIGWLTYDLTGSALLTGLAMGLDAFPQLIFGPIGGILADRFDNRKIILTTIVYQTSVTAAFSLIIVLGYLKPWMVFIYIFAVGISWPVYNPSRYTLIPQLVPKQNLVNAISLDGLFFSTTRIVIPLMAGLLVTYLGAGKTLWMGAALYAMAFVAVYMVKPEQAVKREPRRGSPLREFKDAFTYIWHDPLVFSLIAMGVMVPLLLVAPAQSITPVYAAEVYHVDATGLGVITCFIGAGSVVGTFVLASMGDIKRKGRLFILSLLITILGMMVYAVSRPFPVAIVIMGIYSGLCAVPGTIQMAMVQQIVPVTFRGRVVAVLGMIWAIYPLGGLIFGGIAQVLDAPSATLIGGGFALVIIALAGMASRRLWAHE